MNFKEIILRCYFNQGTATATVDVGGAQQSWSWHGSKKEKKALLLEEEEITELLGYEISLPFQTKRHISVKLDNLEQVNLAVSPFY